MTRSAGQDLALKIEAQLGESWPTNKLEAVARVIDAEFETEVDAQVNEQIEYYGVEM